MLRIDQDGIEMVLTETCFVLRNTDNKTEFRIDQKQSALANIQYKQLFFFFDAIRAATGK